MPAPGSDPVDAAAAVIRARTDLQPMAGVVLGSGLASAWADMEDQVAFAFAELPGFPPASVPGHEGKLVLGRVSGVPAAVFFGRIHFYEHGSMSMCSLTSRLAGALGARTMLLTASVGALDPDLHEAVRADGGKGIVKLRGVERQPVPMEISDAPEASVREYWWVSYYLRPAPFTEPYWTGGDRLLILDDEAFRKTTWMRDEDVGQPVKHWAYRAEAFIPVRNRQEIDWTPGVADLRARQTAEGELEVSVRSATPNLKTYAMRVNGGEWKAIAGDQTRWELQPGKNRLDVRTRNFADVDGPIVSALVEFKR